MVSETDTTGFSCPHCSGQLSATADQRGHMIDCVHCGMPVQVPKYQVIRPVPASAHSGRPFQFRCLRCGSFLEARSEMCGHRGNCPSCSAEFTIPQMDAQTGQAISNADPGPDGELPAPVHAYAAAGDKAPRIIRKPDDTPMIECPRCQGHSPITANNCGLCGLPFTMEGNVRNLQSSSSGIAQASFWLGLIAMPLGFCGGVGILPGTIAVLLAIGAAISGEQEKSYIVGAAMGILACLISIAVFL